MGEKFVYRLEELGREESRLVGGKSANLGEMLRLGVPVPPGFAISSAAYRRFAEVTGLLDEVSRYVGGLGELKEVAQFEDASHALRQMVRGKEIPEDIAAEVALAYVLAYRMRKGMPLFEEMGVCVLKMVKARSAGIAFTADPNTGDRTKVIVEANWGRSIREHSICAGILADMAIGIETARYYYLAVAYMHSHPERYGPQASDFMLSRASIAKVYATEVAIMATNKAMELMGAYGYSREYPVEKYWRDSKAVQLWLGGAQLARLDVCRAYYEHEL